MLKKITAIIALVAVSAGAAVFVSSCAKIAGPLSPDLKLNAASDTAGSALLQVSGGSYPTGVTQTARIQFNLPLNPATVNTSNVLFYALSTDGLSETPYTNVSLSYNAAGQEIVINPASGPWQDNTSYRMELTTGLRSVAGAQLDGNYNDIPEGPQFDNFWTEINLGAPTTPYITKDKAVQVFAAWWASNANPTPGSSFAFGSNVGYVSATYSHVTVTVQFTTSGGVPATFALDPNTFSTGTNALHSNVVFTDANDVPITPLSVSVMTTSYPNDTLIMVFNNLQPSSKYKFKLKGGLTGIRSADTGTLCRYYYFDGNGAHGAEASDDTDVAVLMTQTNEAQNIPRVYVSSSSWNGTLRRWEVTFAVPTGIGAIDPATVINNNFLVWNTYSSLPVIPTSLVVDNSTAPAPVVYVYLPLSISPSGPDTYDCYLTVRKEVRSYPDGITLDQNNDGVLLTDDDNYQSGSTSIIGY